MPKPRLDPHTKLGIYFKLWEATQSTTAARLEIDNSPNEDQLANLILTTTMLMDPIRAEWGRVRVTSGLRVPALNAAIPGSSKTSYHRHGLAFDFKFYSSKILLGDVVAWIADSDLPFDQVIYEYGSWIHIGHAKPGKKPRKQVLMKFKDTKYLTFNSDDPRVVA